MTVSACATARSRAGTSTSRRERTRRGDRCASTVSASTDGPRGRARRAHGAAATRVAIRAPRRRIRVTWGRRRPHRLAPREKKTVADRIAVCSMKSGDRESGRCWNQAASARSALCSGTGTSWTTTRLPARLLVERRLELGVGHRRFLVQRRVVLAARIGIRQHFVRGMNHAHEAARDPVPRPSSPYPKRSRSCAYAVSMRAVLAPGARSR